MLQIPSFFGEFAHMESPAKPLLMSSMSAAALPNLMRYNSAGSKFAEAKPEVSAVSPKHALYFGTLDASVEAEDIGSTRTVEQHIRALRNKKVSVRYHAAETLATLGSKAQLGSRTRLAAQQLCQTLLEDDHVLVRKSAASALGDIGVTTESVLAVLRQAEARDEDQFVRQRARLALLSLERTTSM